MKNEQMKNQKGKEYSELAISSGILIGLISLFIPLPPFFLDILLSLNLALSILLLLLVLNVGKPLEFSSFPGLILIFTLFRLGLGLGCTRAILSQGYSGEVISALGGLMLQGSYAVGLLVLLILFLIQFLVITKGANRTSEVIARFFLDSLPGKQIAIEGELNSGLITQEEAKRKREEVTREGDFYGSMDGAIKFVRGDAILTFILILINLAGGLAIGILQKKMSLEDAFRTYSLLSSGAGLALQVPALLLSSASGLLVTRASTKESLAYDLFREYIPRPKVLSLVLVFFSLLGILSGFSILIILILVGLGGGFAYLSLRKKSNLSPPEKSVEEKPEEVKAEKNKITIEPLRVDPLRIELGYGLINLAQSISSDNLFQTIPVLRREFASELGIRLPRVRVRDNLNLKPFEYSIILKEVELARGELFIDRLLAINPGDLPEIEGIDTIEPAFGFPAKWIDQSKKDEAEEKGYNVVEPKAVLTTHLAERLKENASELLGLQETKELIDELKAEYPALVEEVYPQNLSLVSIQKILQCLLKEGVPIKDLLTIFEVLAEKSTQLKDPSSLTEYVRAGLKRTLTQKYIDTEGKITVFTLDPKLEQSFIPPDDPSEFKLALKPEIAQRIVYQCWLRSEELKNKGVKPVILLFPRARAPFRKFIEESLPDLGILSYDELLPKTKVYSIGSISPEEGLSGKAQSESEVKTGEA